MREILGLLVSFVYVLLVLCIAAVLAKRVGRGEGSRKFVHIALSGWWFIAMFFFSNPLAGAAVPAVFVVVNTMAWRKDVITAIQRDAGENTPGTVYYAVSLLLLALFSFGLNMPYIGALGVLCMGLGDGFAAVVGTAVAKRKKSGPGKSLAGSATMLLVSFTACLCVLLVYASRYALPVALVLAILATGVEYLSRNGLDNLTVPISVSLAYYVWFTQQVQLRALAVGILASGAVALLAWYLHLLTLPAGVGAIVVGTLFYLWGGWPLWVLLIWFFTSSNIAARVVAKQRGGKKQKSPGGRRLVQVLANSLPALLLAAGYRFQGNPWLLVAAAGVLAASTADTWASEVGVYSAKAPVNILNGHPMQRGLSGGVSPLGLGASFLAATCVGLLAMLLFRFGSLEVPTSPLAFLLVVAGGCAGSIVDSLLGISIQAKYRCGQGDTLIETKLSSDCVLVSGVGWVNNDLVNLLSGVLVGAAALPVALLA